MNQEDADGGGMKLGAEKGSWRRIVSRNPQAQGYETISNRIDNDDFDRHGGVKQEDVLMVVDSSSKKRSSRNSVLASRNGDGRSRLVMDMAVDALCSSRKDDDDDDVDDDDVEQQQTVFFTVEEAIECSGFGKFQLLLLFYTGFAWLADAAEMILLSYLGPGARCEWGLSAVQQGLISSSVFLGTFIGSYCWGLLSDMKGRKIGFFVTAIFTLLFATLSAFPTSYTWLLILRGLAGVGIGGGHVVFSLFVEFLPIKGRGFWLVLIDLFWSVGSILEALLAWAIMPSLNWRWLVFFSTPPLLLLCIFYPMLPESPRYLLLQGRNAEATEILERIAHVNKNPRLLLLLNSGTLVRQKKVSDCYGRLIDDPVPAPSAAAGGRSPTTKKVVAHKRFPHDAIVVASPSSTSLSSSSSSSDVVKRAVSADGAVHVAAATAAAAATSLHANSDYDYDGDGDGDGGVQRKRKKQIHSVSTSNLMHHSSELETLLYGYGDGEHDEECHDAARTTTAPATTTTPMTMATQAVSCSTRGAAASAHDDGTRRTKKMMTLMIDQGGGCFRGCMDGMRALLGKSLRRSTCLLWFVSAANAFTYYGLILLATEFSDTDRCTRTGPASLSVGWTSSGSGGEMNATRSTCTSDKRPILNDNDYLNVLTACLGELPGLLIAGAMVDWVGRKATLEFLLFSCVMFTLPLFSETLRNNLSTVLLFGARGSITGAFSVLWAYAPELYPTAVRSTGMGFMNALGRVGGFLCPFVAVALVENCQLLLALTLMSAVPAMAAIACFFFPLETMGTSLEDTLDDS